MLLNTLQQAPADTTSYMIAGFAVIFISIGLYILSLYLRHQNLQQDLVLLEEMESES